MRLEIFKNLFIVCSLIALTGCKAGPKITICQINPLTESLECLDKAGKKFVVRIYDAEGYIAMPIDDLGILIEYCKMKK
jgi:hypothetical protein